MPLLKREKIRRVKRCTGCGCLFICVNNIHSDCSSRTSCICNDCEAKKAKSYGREPQFCEMTIIKSSDKIIELEQKSDE